MISSMTGFGEAELKNERLAVSIQVSSVNNRFLDIKYNNARLIAACETEMSNLVRKRLNRGKVEINFNLTFSPDCYQIKIDDGILSGLIKEVKRVSKKFPIKMDLSLADILSIKGLFNVTETRLTQGDIELVKKTLDKAITKHIAMRKEEGKNLVKEVMTYLDDVSKQVVSIVKEIDKLEATYKTRIMEKAKEISSEFQMDPNRLNSEIAILLNKTDITEEIARLNSHIQQFRSFMDESGPIGKKLDFLCQEMFREINTIGSKICDEKVLKTVITVKDDLEKIREQVQNIE